MRCAIIEMLTDQIRVGFFGFNGTPHTAPDLMLQLYFILATEHIGDIDTPAINAKGRLEPIAHYRVLSSVHVLTQPITVVIQFGQTAHSHEFFIRFRMLVKSVKIPRL